MMLDFDNITYSELENKISCYLDKYTFQVYKTTNGFHVYCTSNVFDYSAFSTLQFMYKLGCDPWYISFTKLYGFVVRLSPKIRDGIQDTFIEQFIGTLGETPELESVLNIIAIKDSYIEQSFYQKHLYFNKLFS